MKAIREPFWAACADWHAARAATAATAQIPALLDIGELYTEGAPIGRCAGATGRAGLPVDPVRRAGRVGPATGPRPRGTDPRGRRGTPASRAHGHPRCRPPGSLRPLRPPAGARPSRGGQAGRSTDGDS